MTLWHLEALRSAVRIHNQEMTDHERAFYEAHFEELREQIAFENGFGSADEAFKELTKSSELSEAAGRMLVNLRKYLEDIGVAIGDTVVA